MSTPLTQLSLEELTARVASAEPTPGGGTVSAIAGSLGAALGVMVWRLTRAKDSARSGVPPEQPDELAERLSSLGDALARSASRDAESYDAVIGALRLPKDTDEQKAVRRAAIQQATRTATEIPLETARLCAEVMERCGAAIRQGHPGALSDAGVGVLVAFAGLQGALYNVRINLADLDDESYKAAVAAEAESLRTQALNSWSNSDAIVREALT